MNQAKSQVQVSIGGKLDPSFNQAFSKADKQMEALGKEATGLNRKIGDIGAFRRQENALKAAASEFTKAKQKVAALKAELAAVENPTRRQAAALNAAERAAARAGGAYSQARGKLADMSRELQRSGVNVTKLSSEYRRLKVELDGANAKYTKHEASLRRQQMLLNGMRTAWQSIGSVAAGTAAAAAVLSRPATKALGYDEQIARLAATAGAGKSVAEKDAIKGRLSNTVEDARKFSGGATREEVASALNTLVASGKFSEAELPNVLKKVSRTAFASGGNSDDIAQMAIAMKQFGVTNLDEGFDRALKAGQVGRFELRDMAKSLPDQLARARAAGYSGIGGLSEILAMNQVAMNTAGSADQAGNNMVNLLAKMNSREFNDSIGKVVKVQKGDPFIAGKKGAKEFDWSAYAQSNREKGINSIESFAMLLERQLAGNKQYQALKSRAAALPEGGDKRDTLMAMANIAEGTELGKVMADLQATAAMLARLQGGEQLKQVRAGIDSSSGAVNADAAFLGNQAFAQKNLAGGAIDRANEETFNSMGPALTATLKGFNDLATEFPKVTTAAYAAATALAAVAAFGAGGAIFDKVTGKPGGGAGGGGAAGAGFASKGPLLKKLGIAGALGAAGYGVYSTATNDSLTGKQKGEGYGGAAGGLAGGLAGAKYGGMAGAFFGPVGAGIGAVAGGIIGSVVGDKLGSMAGGAIVGGESAQAVKDTASAAQEAAKAATTAAGRPNMTFHNTYSLQVTAPQPGAAEMAAQLEKTMRDAQRKAEADARSTWMSLPNY